MLHGCVVDVPALRDPAATGTSREEPPHPWQKYHSVPFKILSSNSEDEDESSEKEGSDIDEHSKLNKPIAVGEENFTSRFAARFNGNARFDLIDNKRGSRTWHSGWFICVSKVCAF